jgi:SAM-dependent methyltransferase
LTGAAADGGTGAGFASALGLVDDVEGWLTDAQALRLWEAARRLSAPASIVEIGSFRGRSTIVLARAAAEGVDVVAIDPHGGGDRGPQQITPDAARGEEDNAAFVANLARAGVTDRVRHVRLPSQDALSGSGAESVDLLYVDGAHRFAPARADIERWGDRVAEGGTLLVHDAYNAIGVTLAQLRLLFVSRRWRYAGRTGSLAEYRREPLGGAARGANALRQAAGLPYFLRNLVIKVLIVARLRPLARLLGHDTGEWPY